MSAAAVYARLRVTDPGRWRAVALAWRRWAALAGGLVADLSADLVRLGAAWSGAAATAAATGLARLRRRLVLFRVLCWQADQAASEFAAALERARRLLAGALTAAQRAGLTIDDQGTVRSSGPPGATGLRAEADAGSARAGRPTAAPHGGADTGSAPAGRPTADPHGGADTGSAPAGRPTAAPHGGANARPAQPGRPTAEPHGGADTGSAPAGWPAADPHGGGRAASDAVAAELAAAIAVAARADVATAERLSEIAAATRVEPERPGLAWPDCTASPAEIARWWAGLGPAGRRWLLVNEPGRLAALDGLPAADRDAANRMLLDERRAELDGSLAVAAAGERGRLRELRRGLDALADRLADDAGARAYLLRLDLAEEGRAVVALGDPDRADNVLTHVPGMTADLASLGGELNRAGRVAERAAELAPAASTSAVLWLDYDAPDFVDEAASARRAEAGAPVLRRFQDGLRAGHEGQPARQTLIGHSYGSLLVGRAAAAEGLAADGVVFVGSPGVGVDSVAGLAVPPDRVWSSTSRNDIIQYAAVAPATVPRDLIGSAAVPVAGPLLAFGRPERDLWFGHNPSDPAFGARVFASSPDGGHLGYWDRGSPSLDALAAITLGTAR